MERFRDKVAIVTGAASGIGAASARRLAADGARVVVADVDATGTHTVADAIGGQALVLDVADAEAWRRAIASIVDEHGGLQLAHLNAGVLTRPHPYALLDVTDAQYRRVMGVNLDGMVLAALLLARHMSAAGGGAIVTTASLAGLGPYEDDPLYAATKHAVVGFVRSAAPQLSASGVRIHAICPGGVDTALTQDPFVRRRLEAHGRPVLDPSEVADAVADLLASDDAGRVCTIVYGRGVEDYQFRGMPGPRMPT